MVIGAGRGGLFDGSRTLPSTAAAATSYVELKRRAAEGKKKGQMRTASGPFFIVLIARRTLLRPSPRVSASDYLPLPVILTDCGALFALS
jgi:hypothetical protein